MTPRSLRGSTMRWARRSTSSTGICMTACRRGRRRAVHRRRHARGFDHIDPFARYPAHGARDHCRRPTLLIDMGYAYSSGAVISTPIGYVASANSPDVKPSAAVSRHAGRDPVALVSRATCSGISSDGIYNDHNVNHNGFGNLTYIRGQHTLKFGITYNHYQKLENATGTSQPGQLQLHQSGATPSAGDAGDAGRKRAECSSTRSWRAS